MAIIKKLMSAKKPKEHSSAASPCSSYRRLSSAPAAADCGRSKKGHVPVTVGCDGACERFHIPARLMAHPLIVPFLAMSADEYGFRQEGVIHIPCEPGWFREVASGVLSKKR